MFSFQFIGMYLHVYLCNSPANPIGIGVIYVLAPNIVGSDPTHQIPKLVNEWSSSACNPSPTH